MMTQIRDRNQKLIGEIRDRGSRLEAYTSTGSLCGTYDKAANQTRNNSGSLVGPGPEHLIALIFANS